MTSKTFKSAWPEHPRKISVEANKEGVNLAIGDPEWRDRYGITVAPSDAPALMQAIGECLPPIPATVREVSYEAFMAVALEYLRKAVRALEAETAEAEAQAELEAEALELFNEYRVAAQLTPIVSWDEAHPLAQEQWIAVARKAREIGAEK